MIYRPFFILLISLFWTSSFCAAETNRPTIVDDFSSESAPHTWQAREPSSTVQYQPGAARLDLPKYTGGQDESRWPGMVRSVGDLNLGLYNGLLVDVTNTTHQTQSLVADFKDGHSTTSALCPSVAPGQRQTLKIAFDHAVTGAVDWTGIQSIVLYQSRPATPQTWLIHGVKLYCDDPNQTAIGQLHALLETTQSIYRQALADKLLEPVDRQHAQQTIERWSKALKAPQSLAGQGNTCRDELTLLQSHLRQMELYKQLGHPQVLWSTDLGTRFEPAEALLQFQKPADKLHFYAAKGQYDDRIVRLSNLGGDTQDWRVRFMSDDPDAATALSIRRNQSIVAADRSVVGDALTPLDAAGTLTLAPGDTAELWIRLDAKHHDLKAGSHSAKLVLQDLRRGVVSQIELPLDLTIHRFDLAAAKPMHLNVWFDTVPFLKGHEQASLDNLTDYGCDVFVIHPWHLPFPKLTAEGEPAAPLDLANFDRLVRMFRACNPRAKLLIGLGLDSDVPDYQQLKSHLALYSPQWNKGMRFWVGQFMERMKQLDIPLSDYAFYVSDEPDDDELDLTRAVATIARSIDPGVRIYVNGINIYFDKPELNKQLMDLSNIWQLGGDYLGVRPTLLSTLKSDKQLDLWVYQCRTGTRGRQLGADAYNYYRLLSWQALRDGMTGIGYWVYCWNTAKDLWDGTTGDGSNLVYPDAGNGVLASVRWELVRTSLDDVKYYRLLQLASDTKLSMDLKTKIDALLGERFNQVLAHPLDPRLAVQWRIDAGTALDAVSGQQ
ncbi:MAG: DUF4091 domain-containing protein [Phycisphaerales bacterium]|jgi:hypothetical protein|nr:DUF4091 domain-containing protein [Phycisphaerales bacterium]